jgi:hypothetical protein
MRQYVMAAMLAGGAAVGCYNPSINHCSVHCTGNEACPDSMTCAGDGFCHFSSGDPANCSIVDAGDSNTTVTLTVDAATGLGTGTITADVNLGFSCSSGAVGTGACQLKVPANMTVQLTEMADSTSLFNSWGGAGAACFGQFCTITVTGDESVSAAFDPAAAVTIDYDPGGAGDGSVTSIPSGSPNGFVTVSPVAETTCEDITNVNHDSTCTALYPVGASIELDALPNNDGSVFGGWEGEGGNGTPCPNNASTQCTFTLGAAGVRFGVRFN